MRFHFARRGRRQAIAMRQQRLDVTEIGGYVNMAAIVAPLPSRVQADWHRIGASRARSQIGYRGHRV
ncbi:MAG: hypothetical protein U5L02_06520 [Rheinheimera sp.]|nr:hypothetical protein [Rheinheimera sp.]